MKQWWWIGKLNSSVILRGLTFKGLLIIFVQVGRILMRRVYYRNLRTVWHWSLSNLSSTNDHFSRLHDCIIGYFDWSRATLVYVLGHVTQLRSPTCPYFFLDHDCCILRRSTTRNMLLHVEFELLLCLIKRGTALNTVISNRRIVIERFLQKLVIFLQKEISTASVCIGFLILM